MASLIIDTEPIPSATSISLDGQSTIIGPRFKGFSQIPKGWHLFSYDSSSTSSEPSITSSGINGVRHSILRYFHKDVIVLRKWDSTLEMIQPIIVSSQDSSRPHSLTSEQLASYRSMLAPYPIHNPSNQPKDDLERIQETAVRNWSMAIASLNSLGEKESRKLVKRIFGPNSKEAGFDSFSGDAKMDSLSEIWSPSTSQVKEEESRTDPVTSSDGTQTEDPISNPKFDSQGRPYWGTARPQDDSNSNGNGKDPLDEGEDGRPTGSLKFTDFDLKRSWPKGSNGEERTRWSVDKSWLLQDVIERSGGPSYLLAELELSFLLFLSSHNPYCLDHFNLLISLFSQSVEILGSPSSFKLHPAFISDSGLSNINTESNSSSESSFSVRVTPSLHSSFLRNLTSLFRLLPSDFFSSQIDPETTKMERRIKMDLSNVRRNIGSALSFKASRDRRRETSNGDREEEEMENSFQSAAQRRKERNNRSNASNATSTSKSQTLSGEVEDSLLSQELTSLIPAWRSLSHLCSSHFGWKLDSKLDEEVEVKEESSVIKASGRRDEDDEDGDGEAKMDEEEEEDDEDLPVVVDLDEERRGWL